MAPAAVFLLPFFLLYTKVFVIGSFKLYDTPIGLILLYCTFHLPFAIWTLRPTIDGIPKELDEAAPVDGCSTWQVIREVVWPLADPGYRRHLHPDLGLRLERVPVGGDADQLQRPH